MAKLKSLTLGGITNDVPITGVKGNAENDYRTGDVNITPADIGISQTYTGSEEISTSDETTFTTSTRSLTPGTYIVIGRGIYSAGSGTGNFRCSASVVVGATAVLCARIRVTPNNEQFDLPFCYSFVLNTTTNVGIRVTSTVAKRIGARWAIIKIG